MYEAQQEEKLKAVKSLKNWLINQNFTKKSLNSACKLRNVDHTLVPHHHFIDNNPIEKPVPIHPNPPPEDNNQASASGINRNTLSASPPPFIPQSAPRIAHPLPESNTHNPSPQKYRQGTQGGK
eukprot:GHVR01137676.1.p1 GENE.GHVR01137676.1~~GHVR01137676.1.p1  ORF type:complete len:124 (-),score=15.91 GHVR01137676.1:1535-1906(-)